jgi:Anti-sigma factor NepR
MNKRKVHHTPYEVEAVPKKLGSEIKAKIGQQLRAMYSDVVNQGIPDRFAEILRKLDEKSSADASVIKAGSSANEGSSSDKVSQPSERSNGPPR